MEEGPKRMINLLLEKQIKNLVFGKLSDSDDFEDWLKCVEEEEYRRNEIFFNEHVKKNYSIVF